MVVATCGRVAIIMMLPHEEVAAILENLDAENFGAATESARRLLRMPGTSVRRHGRTVPATEVRDVYRSRSLNRCIREPLRKQNHLVAQVAECFLAERWCMYLIKNDLLHVSVFSNEEGLGRACIDYQAEM